MTLKQATQPIDTDVYEPVGVVQSHYPTPPVIASTPMYNPFLRCQLPLVNASSDQLRQFYNQGVPQARIMATF